MAFGGSFGDLKPGPCHLKEDFALSLGAGSLSPTKTFLRILAIFLSHDTKHPAILRLRSFSSSPDAFVGRSQGAHIRLRRAASVPCIVRFAFLQQALRRSWRDAAHIWDAPEP